MVPPFVSRLVPVLWHEALSLLSTAAQHGHGSRTQTIPRSSSVAGVFRAGPGPTSLSSSSDAARNPRGGLCRRERGAGGFRGAAGELMEDAVRQQGGLCFVGLCVPKTLSSGGAARWIADNYETVRTEPGAGQRANDVAVEVLALQLRFCFEVRALSGSLVSSAPE